MAKLPVRWLTLAEIVGVAALVIAGSAGDARATAPARSLAAPSAPTGAATNISLW